MTKYSVWRNGQRVGSVHVVIQDDSDLVYGLLHPEIEEADLEELTQWTPPFLPHRPTFETIDGGSPRPRRTVVTLRKLDPIEAKGISPDRKLELRRSDGARLGVDLISVSRGSPSCRDRVAEACEREGLPFTRWEVTAHITDRGTEKTPE